jgi:NAD(P)-dependent dehydrogenase (short-subunit alcohol dehydrogenase family)
MTSRESKRMARILITGSADGLGQMAAQRLVGAGHDVVLHARNRERSQHAMQHVPGAHNVLIGDLSSIAETRTVADQANALGPFDAIIHNAGVGYQEPRIETSDGLEHVFAINVLAPYLLTALIDRPRRLIYLSSGMHRGGIVQLDDLQWKRRRWNGAQAYSDSKLYDVVLAFAVARLWPNVISTALEPGWVPTKMGGPGAPDDMEQAPETQVWLASSDDAEAQRSGQYYYHRKLKSTHAAVSDVEVQEGLLAACEKLSGVTLAAAAGKG